MSDQVEKKIGLALSGGGLRASFYHIGVFAQMAEQGLLKSVEVISSVSGGSIIAALYYLHLKKLLESKVDADITDQDYIDLIKVIEVDFLKATEKNIRTSVLASFKQNFRMKNSDYSRSDRIAELYNKYLYQSVLENVGTPVEMQALKIYPLDCPEDFHPKTHNSERTAKVPILALNATTLNGGRNWQFTAQTMGELGTRDEKKEANSKDHLIIDKKPIRLRRATGDNGYQGMVENQQNFSLGHAVAASACVPGLFDPLAISHLYYDKAQDEEITPQLIDGGIYDNQGTEGLLKYPCTHIIVSDASGQMGMDNQVETSTIPVLLRVLSVLQDRTRTIALLHLEAKKGRKNIAFMNLRQGLGIRKVSWIDADNKPAEDDIVIDPTTEEFNVAPEVQNKLSLMRTDLDAFTEVEAYSLMLNGYQTSEKELSEFLEAKQQPKTEWRFNQIAPWVKNPELDPNYLKQLEVAEETFGKALKVLPWLWIPIILIAGIIVYYFRIPIVDFILTGSIPIYVVVVALVMLAINMIIPKVSKLYSVIKFLRHPSIAISKRLGKALLLVLVTILIKFYLKFINPLYLAQGRVAKLKK